MARWTVRAAAEEAAAGGTAAPVGEPAHAALASLAAVVLEDRLVGVAECTAEPVAPGADTVGVKVAAVAEDMSGPEPDWDIVDTTIEEEAAPAFGLNMNMTSEVA